MKNNIIAGLVIALSITSGGWIASYDDNKNLEEVVSKKKEETKKQSTEIAKLGDIIEKKDNDLKADKKVIDEQKAKVSKLKESKKELKKNLDAKSKELNNVKEELKKEKNKNKVSALQVNKVDKSKEETNFHKKKKGDDVVNKSYDTTMTVTAYTSGKESTGKSRGEKGYGLTASGKTVSEGRTISCPKEVPFGTVMDIEGVGRRVCEDTGSAITTGHIDLYIADLSRAQQFGVRQLKVKVGS